MFCLTLSSSVRAYELGTHARLTQKAYERSVLSNAQAPALFSDLGIDHTVVNPFGDIYYDVAGGALGEQRRANRFEARFMPVPAEELLTLPAWLMRGAIREDDWTEVDRPCLSRASTQSAG